MRIEVWDNGGKTCDRYTVIIGRDVFMMSTNADMSSGCNYFHHRRCSDASYDLVMERLGNVKLPKIPKCLIPAIRHRIRDHWG
jgi:hypothetical protein